MLQQNLGLWSRHSREMYCLFLCSELWFFLHEANVGEFFLSLECQTSCQLTIKMRKRFALATSEDRCGQVLIIIRDEYKCYHYWVLSFVYFFRIPLESPDWESCPQTLITVLCHSEQVLLTYWCDSMSQSPLWLEAAQELTKWHATQNCVYFCCPH